MGILDLLRKKKKLSEDDLYDQELHSRRYAYEKEKFFSEWREEHG